MATTKRKISPRLTKDARSSAILKSAREVFEEKGYEKATVAEIAERIDVVEGTVFHYFGSKRKLVLSVMESFYAQITEELGNALSGIQGTHARLRYVIWFHIRTVADNARLCSVILNESRGVDLTLTKGIQALNRSYTDIFRDVIREGIEKQELREDLSYEVVRNIVYGSIEHMLWDFVSHRKSIQIDERTDQLLNILLAGIERPNGPSRRELNDLVRKLNKLL